MCIRDRRCFAGTSRTAGTWWALFRRPRAPPGSPSWASSRQRAAVRREWMASVSYTHLTLPTICSV
eukprot:1738952-Alexandrium_andersonii.AAC.1